MGKKTNRLVMIGFFCLVSGTGAMSEAAFGANVWQKTNKLAAWAVLFSGERALAYFILVNLYMTTFK